MNAPASTLKPPKLWRGEFVLSLIKKASIKKILIALQRYGCNEVLNIILCIIMIITKIMMN